MRLFNNTVIIIFYVWRLSDRMVEKNSIIYSLFTSLSVTVMMMILRPHNSNGGVKKNIKCIWEQKGIE